MAQLNPAALSKINWTNGIAFIATVGAVFGMDLKPEVQLQIVAGIGMATQVASIIFRTFMTKKPA